MFDNMCIIKAHTRRAVLESPDMPDVQLMIGEAEELDGVTLRIPQTKLPKAVVKSVKTISDSMDNDTLMDAIANNVLEVNDISMNVALLNEKMKLSGGGV